MMNSNQVAEKDNENKKEQNCNNPDYKNDDNENEDLDMRGRIEVEEEEVEVEGEEGEVKGENKVENEVEGYNDDNLHAESSLHVILREQRDDVDDENRIKSEVGECNNTIKRNDQNEQA